MEIPGGGLETHRPSDQRCCVLGSRCLLDNAPYFSRGLRASIERYRQHPHLRPVIDILDTRQQASINNWLDPHESKTLFIGRYERTREISCWTTDVFLELMGIFGRVYNTIGAKNANTILLVHLCDHNKEVLQVETMMHNLLVQLRKYDEHVFINHKRCEEWDQLRCGISGDADIPERLWGVLEQCIVDSGMRHLVIMLDNVDVLFESKDRDVFSGFLKHLWAFVHRTSIVVKLLITNRSPHVGAYMEQLRLSADVALEHIKLEHSPKIREPQRW